MTTSFLATAWLLLMTPPGAPESLPPDHAWSGLTASLRLIAISNEWADCDGGIFTSPSNFQDDLDLIRRRIPLLADAPRIGDAKLFPHIDHIREGRRFNRRFREHLQERLAIELDRFGAIQQAISETDRLFVVWDLADDAACDSYGVAKRRTALKRLREILGEDDYLSGRLPPPVPTWRFNEGR